MHNFTQNYVPSPASLTVSLLAVQRKQSQGNANDRGTVRYERCPIFMTGIFWGQLEGSS